MAQPTPGSFWLKFLLGFSFGAALAAGALFAWTIKHPSATPLSTATATTSSSFNPFASLTSISSPDSSLTDSDSTTTPIVFGFLPYWLINDFHPASLTSLTTLSYFGLLIAPDGHLVTVNAAGERDPGFHQLQSAPLQDLLLQARQKHLTLSLAVYLQDDEQIAALLTDPIPHAQNLIADVTPLMQEYHFTDLNIDIESFATATPAARQNFTLFMEEIRRGVDAQQLGTTLSLDLAPRAAIEPYLFDPVALGQIVDHVFLMTYDYHVRSSALTGPVAPLGGYPEVRNFDVRSGLQATAQSIPPAKIILGVPLYGYQWETVSPDPGQPVVPRSGLTASQRRVTDLLAECGASCSRHFDPVARQPYVVSAGPIEGFYQQFYYEDAESLTYKIELAREQQLAGIGLWALGYEQPGALAPLQQYWSGN